MERIQGLKEYVQTEHYLEGIGIGKEEQKEIQIAYQPLAQGEYNINYWFVHPLTGKKLVLRVNTCLLYTSPSPRDVEESRMPSSA